MFAPGPVPFYAAADPQSSPQTVSNGLQIRVYQGLGRNVPIPETSKFEVNSKESFLNEKGNDNFVFCQTAFDPSPHLLLRNYLTDEEHARMVNHVNYLVYEIVKHFESKSGKYICLVCILPCFAPFFVPCLVLKAARESNEATERLQSETIPRLNQEYGFTSRGIQYRLVIQQDRRHQMSYFLDVEVAPDAVRIC